MPKGRQGTLISDVWYSRISMFSLIDILKYLRRVLFPSMVVSALSGLVFSWCQDFNCLTTGSRF